jgi:hypothetical protein
MDAQSDIVLHRNGIDGVTDSRRRGSGKIVTFTWFQAVAGSVKVDTGKGSNAISMESRTVDEFFVRIR